MQAYDRVIRDFEVSGVISVALEPLATEERKIQDLRRRMDRLVLGALDPEARAKVLAVLGESEEEMTTLGQRDQLLALVDLFRLLTPAGRKAVLSPSRLDSADRDLLHEHADSQDDQRRRAVFRKFTDAQAYFILQGYETLKRFRRELARQEGGRPAYPALNTMRVLDARKAIRTFEKLGWKRDIRTLPEYARKYAARRGAGPAPDPPAGPQGQTLCAPIPARAWGHPFLPGAAL